MPVRRITTSPPREKFGGWIALAPRKRPEYEICRYTTGTFEAGQVVPGLQYDLGKEGYDIRLKEWDGGILHISGRKRETILSFLEEKRYVITPEYYHYRVRARGKNPDPLLIAEKVQALGLRFLWVRVIGETIPREDRER